MTCKKCHTDYQRRSLDLDGGQTTVFITLCECRAAEFAKEFSETYERERESEQGD